MTDALREQIVEAAEIHALVNAVKHESEADVGAVMGPLMSENPEFREYSDTVSEIVPAVVERVNDLDLPERRERLEALAPDRVADLKTTEKQRHPLPDLPGVESVAEVRMRMAPNPNGPLHLGSARMPAVIGTYKDRYDGWMLCRFDDTDPETKRPDLDAYDAILDAVEYLGFEPDAVIRASDRLETYYEHARNLIDVGGAYTCSCPADQFRDRKATGEPCEHRGKDSNRILDEFEAMIDGEFTAGEMVLRVRTDINHDNPALRDWVAFRMVDEPHPRSVAAAYRCWPMLDFQSAIDDHCTDITHIIRGVDLQDSAKRQQFIYDYFDWEYPEVIHWGHVEIDEYSVPMSTSTIRELIESGELDGWDDPRAPTVASLKRRGIRGEAIVDAMVELGTSTSHVDLAMSRIYANNRQLIDSEADRHFFVRNGKEFQVIDSPAIGTPPVHPDHEERGTREIAVNEEVLLEPDDVRGHDERVWLKGLGGFRFTREALRYETDDIKWVRADDVPVVHWVPADTGVAVKLRMPAGETVGVAEPGFTDATVDDVVQFERVGYARVDDVTVEPRVTYFSHP